MKTMTDQERQAINSIRAQIEQMVDRSFGPSSIAPGMTWEQAQAESASRMEQTMAAWRRLGIIGFPGR